MKTEQECGYSDEFWRRRHAESLMEEYSLMAEREKKERHDVEFLPLWMLLLQGKVSFFPWLKLLWSKRAALFATYPGFFYLCILIGQLMLIPILIMQYAVFAGDGFTLRSNLCGCILWLGIPLDVVSHLIVLYVFAKLDVFDS